MAGLVKKAVLLSLACSAALLVGCSEKDDDAPVLSTRAAFNACAVRLRPFGRECECFYTKTYYVTYSVSEYTGYNCAVSPTAIPETYLISYFRDYLAQFPATAQQEMIQMWKYAY